ncbi:MAG: aminoglycoside phosphotransferase family protein [Nannocystaceae bacterium]
MRPLDPSSVGAAFAIDASFVDMKPTGNGHINDTFIARYRRARTCFRVIHQRINPKVFPRPDLLMHNIGHVTRHCVAHLRRRGVPDLHRRALSVVPTHDGQPYATLAGEVWRTYNFIEGAVTHETIDSPQLAAEVGRAFAHFQATLADLEPTLLHETIPDFHRTPTRYHNLCALEKADLHHRAATVQPEMDFAHARATMMHRITQALDRGDLPLRVTHNDTKLSNLMIDLESGEGICVIDLDTVMPGSALYDFGDMVRSIPNPAAEDERDLSRVQLRLPYYAALVRGYLEGSQSQLTPYERELLPLSGAIISLETGMRFLADHLAGDVYCKTARVGQNLDRCRTQFPLVERLEGRMNELQALTREAS